MTEFNKACGGESSGAAAAVKDVSVNLTNEGLRSDFASSEDVKDANATAEAAMTASLPVRDGEWRGFYPFSKPNPHANPECYTWTNGKWRCYRGGSEGYGTVQLTMQNGKFATSKWNETGSVCNCGQCVIWSDDT